MKQDVMLKYIFLFVVVFVGAMTFTAETVLLTRNNSFFFPILFMTAFAFGVIGSTLSREMVI